MTTPTTTSDRPVSNRTASARATDPVTALRATLRRVHQRRRAEQRLRREFAEYRTPAERAEIQEIYARHDAALPATFYQQP
jgi:hypothetical protein